MIAPGGTKIRFASCTGKDVVGLPDLITAWSLILCSAQLERAKCVRFFFRIFRAVVFITSSLQLLSCPTFYSMLVSQCHSRRMHGSAVSRVCIKKECSTMKTCRVHPCRVAGDARKPFPFALWRLFSMPTCQIRFCLYSVFANVTHCAWISDWPEFTHEKVYRFERDSLF